MTGPCDLGAERAPGGPAGTPAGARRRLTWTPWIVGLTLGGILLLRLPVLLVAAVALTLASTAVAALASRRVDRIGLLLLANHAVWIGSGLVVGTLHLETLASAAFYEGDGRILIAYLPLLFFTVGAASPADVRTTVRLVEAAAVLSLGLFGLWLATRLPELSVGRAGHFAGLGTSHTGAGTVHGVLGVFLLVQAAEAGQARRALLGAALLLPAFASGSREALLAVVASLSWHVATHLRIRRLPAVAAGAAVLALLLALAAPALLERTARIASAETVESAWATFRQGGWEWGDEWTYAGREHNVLVRMLYWRHALDRFASSPVVGIGFGRFTDAQLHGWGVPGVLDLALEGSELVTAPGGAHNSYLHLLAENGLVGLGLMLALWAAIARRLSVLAHSRPRGDEVRAAALAGQAVVVFALVGACFGHALAAPTVCLPALAILGVLVAAGAPHAAPLAPRKRGQTPFPGADPAARRRASPGKGV